MFLFGSLVFSFIALVWLSELAKFGPCEEFNKITLGDERINPRVNLRYLG